MEIFILFTVVLPHYNTVSVPPQPIVASTEIPLLETRIEDGKLLYERRWYVCLSIFFIPITFLLNAAFFLIHLLNL